MAEVDFLGTALAVFIPLTAALVVLILLPRWIRSRAHRQVRVRRKERDPDADRAFNDLLTVQAIERELRHSGLETSQASERLREAWVAYEASQFIQAEEMAGEARALLGELRAPISKEEPLPIVEVEALPESKPVLGTEYPKNFLQARFMISMLKDAIGKGSSKRKRAARKLLKEAEQAFEGERYTESLSLALNARKTLEGRELEEFDNQASCCPSCGESMSAEDTFCGKCGSARAVALACPECGQQVGEEDVFCRKCGTALSHDTPKTG